MKWPKSITIIRHGQSIYNELLQKKKRDPEYEEFCKEYERGPSKKLQTMARAMRRKYALNVSDAETPLSENGRKQAKMTGSKFGKKGIPIPDVVLVSPYLRTKQTLEAMIDGGFFSLCDDSIAEYRIREQEHGLALLYNDWRVFQSLHPEQREFHELMGPYWYQYPQGESVSMVRERIQSFTTTLIREYANKHVMLITHHLTILSIRANFERLMPEEFIRLDEHEKPVNCGVTIYKGNPHVGSNGGLELLFYNKKLY